VLLRTEQRIVQEFSSVSIFDCSTSIYGRAFVEGVKNPGLIIPLNRNYDRLESSFFLTAA
jgi:hypothetical protein